MLRFRLDASDDLRTLDSVFADEAFELAINPDGAAAFRRQLQGGRTGAPRPATGILARDSLRAVVKSRGIWPDVGEGSMYYSLSIPMLVERVGAFVTPALRAYLKMESVEQRRPSASDGSFMVPRDEIVDRIATAERFLEAYPLAAQASQVANNRNRYVTWLLYPAVNFMGFDQTLALLADARKAMERLASERSSYPSGKAAIGMLDLLKANGYRRTPAVQAFISHKWQELHDQTRVRIPPS